MIHLLRNISQSLRDIKLPILSRQMDFRKCAMRETANIYCNCADNRALALASSVLYFFGLLHDCAPKKAASSWFLQCISGMKPRLENSFSRRSVIGISVGHLSATSPSSVEKVW